MMVGVPRAGVHTEKVAEMRRMVGAKNNAELSRVLQVPPPVISKINHGKLTIGAAIIISLHEETGISIKEIKTSLGLAQSK